MQKPVLIIILITFLCVQSNAFEPDTINDFYPIEGATTEFEVLMQEENGFKVPVDQSYDNLGSQMVYNTVFKVPVAAQEFDMKLNIPFSMKMDKKRSQRILTSSQLDINEERMEFQSFVCQYQPKQLSLTVNISKFDGLYRVSAMSQNQDHFQNTLVISEDEQRLFNPSCTYIEDQESFIITWQNSRKDSIEHTILVSESEDPKDIHVRKSHINGITLVAKSSIQNSNVLNIGNGQLAVFWTENNKIYYEMYQQSDLQKVKSTVLYTFEKNIESIKISSQKLNPNKFQILINNKSQLHLISFEYLLKSQSIKKTCEAPILNKTIDSPADFTVDRVGTTYIVYSINQEIFGIQVSPLQCLQSKAAAPVQLSKTVKYISPKILVLENPRDSEKLQISIIATNTEQERIYRKTIEATYIYQDYTIDDRNGKKGDKSSVTILVLVVAASGALAIMLAILMVFCMMKKRQGSEEIRQTLNQRLDIENNQMLNS